MRTATHFTTHQLSPSTEKVITSFVDDTLAKANNLLGLLNQKNITNSKAITIENAPQEECDTQKQHEKKNSSVSTKADVSTSQSAVYESADKSLLPYPLGAANKGGLLSGADSYGAPEPGTLPRDFAPFATSTPVRTTFLENYPSSTSSGKFNQSVSADKVVIKDSYPYRPTSAAAPGGGGGSSIGDLKESSVGYSAAIVPDAPKRRMLFNRPTAADAPEAPRRRLEFNHPTTTNAPGAASSGFRDLEDTTGSSGSSVGAITPRKRLQFMSSPQMRASLSVSDTTQDSFEETPDDTQRSASANNLSAVTCWSRSQAAVAAEDVRSRSNGSRCSSEESYRPQPPTAKKPSPRPQWEVVLNPRKSSSLAMVAVEREPVSGAIIERTSWEKMSANRGEVSDQQEADKNRSQSADSNQALSKSNNNLPELKISGQFGRYVTDKNRNVFSSAPCKSGSESDRSGSLDREPTKLDKRGRENEKIIMERVKKLRSRGEKDNRKSRRRYRRSSGGRKRSSRKNSFEDAAQNKPSTSSDARPVSSWSRRSEGRSSGIKQNSFEEEKQAFRNGHNPNTALADAEGEVLVDKRTSTKLKIGDKSRNYSAKRYYVDNQYVVDHAKELFENKDEPGQVVSRDRIRIRRTGTNRNHSVQAEGSPGGPRALSAAMPDKQLELSTTDNTSCSRSTCRRARQCSSECSMCNMHSSQPSQSVSNEKNIHTSLHDSSVGSDTALKSRDHIAPISRDRTPSDLRRSSATSVTREDSATSVNSRRMKGAFIESDPQRMTPFSYGPSGSSSQAMAPFANNSNGSRPNDKAYELFMQFKLQHGNKVSNPTQIYLSAEEAWLNTKKVVSARDIN